MASAKQQNEQRPHGRLGPGRYINSRGYVMVLRPLAGRTGEKYVGEHVLIAETALGHPLPDEAEVHHFDNDHAHNENNNLVVCQDHSYHELLHYRQRIVELGGDANAQKQCTACKRLLLFSEFARERGRVYNLKNTCHDCERERSIRRKQQIHSGVCVVCAKTFDFHGPGHKKTCGDACFRDLEAQRATKNGTFAKLLNALKINPGITSRELATAAGVRRHAASAILPIFERRGLVMRCAATRQNGRIASTWKASEPMSPSDSEPEE